MVNERDFYAPTLVHSPDVCAQDPTAKRMHIRRAASAVLFVVGNCTQSRRIITASSSYQDTPDENSCFNVIRADFSRHS